MSRTVTDRLWMNRLIGAAKANLEDAGVWRWYADMMEERRIGIRWIDERWVVTVDREKCAVNASFDAAIREAIHWAAGRETQSLEKKTVGGAKGSRGFASQAPRIGEQRGTRAPFPLDSDVPGRQRNEGHALPYERMVHFSSRE